MSANKAANFPREDFQGLILEIWQSLGGCFYHAGYVKVYANTHAMHISGSKRRLQIIEAMSASEREQLQEDLIIFRSHFAAVLWQLCHLAHELIPLAYRRLKQEGVITPQEYETLCKAHEDDPIVKEIREYRNLSHQQAGVIVTVHDATDAFVGHFFPPLDANSPAHREEVSLSDPDLQKRELDAKLHAYCVHVGGYCEGLFRVIDAKLGKTVLPRARGFSVTVPYSYQGQLPKGAKDVIYVRVNSPADS
jgi:hypothetical protein